MILMKISHLGWQCSLKEPKIIYKKHLNTRHEMLSLGLLVRDANRFLNLQPTAISLGAIVPQDGR